MDITLPLYDTEAISVNYNDKEIMKAENILSEIVRTIQQVGYKTSSEFMKDEENVKMLRAFDKTLSTRFGFNIKIKTVDAVDLHTSGLSIENDTGFRQNKVKLYKQVEKFGTTQDKSILKDIKKMEKEVTDSLFKGKLVLDDKDVKVYGINEEAVAIIWCGLVELVSLGTTTRQLMGEIMHEVGHCYYGIRYIHQTRSYNTELSTNLAIVTKDPKNLNKKIKHMIIDGEKLEDEGTVLNAINLANKTIEASERNRLNTMKENERLADQFATRFGYAADVATGLRLLEKKIGKHETEFLKESVYGIYYTTLFQTLSIFIPTLRVIATISALTTNVMLMFFSSNLYAYAILGLFFPNLDNRSPKDYDDIKERLKRMKQDVNKHLAENPDDKELCTEALKTIDRLDDEIDNTPYDRTVLQSLVKYTFNNDVAAGQIVRDRLDALAGNDMHAQAAKFSIL